MGTILVVIGTPISNTLNHALAQRYVDAARAGGAEVLLIDLARDPIPPHPTHPGEQRMPRADHPGDTPLDPDVAEYMVAIERADHIVVFFPQWWGTYPAALKAFIDRMFLPGFAFRYQAWPRWERLLVGRTARIVMTMDSPRFWNAVVYRNAAETSLKRAIFAYTGIRTRGITRFAEVRNATAATREKWLAIAERLGAKDAASAGSGPSRGGRAAPRTSATRQDSTRATAR